MDDLTRMTLDEQAHSGQSQHDTLEVTPNQMEETHYVSLLAEQSHAEPKAAAFVVHSYCKRLTFRLHDVQKLEETNTLSVGPLHLHVKTFSPSQ